MQIKKLLVTVFSGLLRPGKTKLLIQVLDIKKDLKGCSYFK